LVLEVGSDPSRYFAWRFDWEVSTETACLVETTGGNGFWIKLQPRTMKEHEDVWLTGKIALEAWKENQKQRKAAKKRDQALNEMVETTRSNT